MGERTKTYWFQKQQEVGDDISISVFNLQKWQRRASSKHDIRFIDAKCIFKPLLIGSWKKRQDNFSLSNIMVQMKDFKLTFLRTFSSDKNQSIFCRVLQNKIFKDLRLKNSNISCNWSHCKPGYLIWRLRENFYISSLGFPEVRRIRWVTLRLCYLQYRENHSFVSYLETLRMGFYQT